MTKMVNSQRKAHVALLATQGIFAEAGALTEVIQNDFGEDLIVQTQHDDMVDNFQLIVQVKGRRKLKKSGKNFIFSIDVDHMIRWISHIQPVLICIYEEKSKKIFVLQPSRYFSLFDLTLTKKKTKSMKFGLEDTLDVSAARKLIWGCRIEYYYKLYAWEDYNLSGVLTEDVSKRYVRRSEKNLHIIAFNFLLTVGIVLRNDEIAPEFRKMIKNASYNFSIKNKHVLNNDLGIAEVFILSMLGFCQEVTGHGLPTNIMEHGAFVAEELFKKFHPDEYKSANNNFLNY